MYCRNTPENEIVQLQWFKSLELITLYQKISHTKYISIFYLAIFNIVMQLSI